MHDVVQHLIPLPCSSTKISQLILKMATFTGTYEGIPFKKTIRTSSREQAQKVAHHLGKSGVKGITFKERLSDYTRNNRIIELPTEAQVREWVDERSDMFDLVS